MTALFSRPLTLARPNYSSQNSYTTQKAGGGDSYALAFGTLYCSCRCRSGNSALRPLPQVVPP
jgi:hypothetical protein